MSLYKHQPLASSKTCIRLLRYIAPDAFEVLVSDLDCCPPFRALSYEWGDGVPRMVSVSGHAVAIKPNLYAFLAKLAFKDKYFWCDAICIDQDSNTERNHQVQLMRRIYSSAEATIAWLGEGQQPLFAQEDKMATYERLAALTRRTYWTRVWIIQEIVVSNKIFLQCGDEIMSWVTLTEACTFPPNQNVRWAADLWMIPEYADDEFRRRRASLGREIHHSMFNALAQTRRRWPMKMDALHSLVERYESSMCQDDRDNVIALLGIAKETVSLMRFNIDYSLNKEDTFYTLLMWAESGAVPVRHRMRFAYAIARGLKLEKISLQPIRFTIAVQTWGVDVTTAQPSDLPIYYIRTSLKEEATFLGSLDTGVLFTCQKSVVTGVGVYDLKKPAPYAEIWPAATKGWEDAVVLWHHRRATLQLSNSAQLEMLINHGFERSYDVVPEKAISTQRLGGIGSLPTRQENEMSIRERLLRDQTALSNPVDADMYFGWDEKRVQLFDSTEADFNALVADAASLARCHDPELLFSSPTFLAGTGGQRIHQSIPSRKPLRQHHYWTRALRRREKGADTRGLYRCSI